MRVHGVGRGGGGGVGTSWCEVVLHSAPKEGVSTGQEVGGLDAASQVIARAGVRGDGASGVGTITCSVRGGGEIDLMRSYFVDGFCATGERVAGSDRTLGGWSR